jgi:hypothetical protein
VKGKINKLTILVFNATHTSGSTVFLMHMHSRKSNANQALTNNTKAMNKSSS